MDSSDPTYGNLPTRSTTTCTSKSTTKAIRGELPVKTFKTPARRFPTSDNLSLRKPGTLLPLPLFTTRLQLYSYWRIRNTSCTKAKLLSSEEYPSFAPTKFKQQSDRMSATAPTSRTREQPQGDEEATADLRLGEFQNVPTLTLSEARLLINAVMDHRKQQRKVEETE